MSSLNNLNRQKKDRTEYVTDGFSGFEEIQQELLEYIRGAESSNEILLAGAEAFLGDLNKLTKPISRIKKSGYTHLIDSFAIDVKSQSKEIVIGWGKYYGRMVERGTEKMYARAHMYPLWEHNEEKYYKIMLEKSGLTP